MSAAHEHHRRGVELLVGGEARQALGDLRRAVQLDPGAWAFRVNLASALEAVGDIDGAIRELRQAMTLSPERPEPACNLGGVLGRRGDLAGAIEAYEAARATDPGCSEAWQGLAWALTTAGRTAELDPLYAAWAAAMPGDPVVRGLAARGRGEAAGDPAFVRAYFDRFAATYDGVLDALGERGPAAIEAVLHERLGAPRGELCVLDAGCGTGRLAAMLRPWAKALHGIDLSAEMLRRAAARGQYDGLTEGDLSEVAEGGFDLVVAADVLTYAVDLHASIAALAGALREGGLLLATFERSDGDTVEARPEGRSAHPRAHVQAALEAAGLVAIDLKPLTLRDEAGVPAPGWRAAAASPRTSSAG